MPRERPADRHPGPGALRSYLDGELGWLAARRCGHHLRRCRDCRALLAEEVKLNRNASELLAHLDVPADTAEGWRRLQVLGGGVHPCRTLRPGLRRTTAVTAVAVALGLIAFFIIHREGPRLAPAGGPTRIQDLCCWDLDGGGPGDDGVLTVTLSGQRVVALALYEDRNRSGSLTSFDPIRYASAQAGAPVGLREKSRFSQIAPAVGLIVRDFCCADYDGGGPRDDGVFTINRPGERVEEVVLYEDVDQSRSLSPADRVRWRTGFETARARPDGVSQLEEADS